MAKFIHEIRFINKPEIAEYFYKKFNPYISYDEEFNAISVINKYDTEILKPNEEGGWTVEVYFDITRNSNKPLKKQVFPLRDHREFDFRRFIRLFTSMIKVNHDFSQLEMLIPLRTSEIVQIFKDNGMSLEKYIERQPVRTLPDSIIWVLNMNSNYPAKFGGVCTVNSEHQYCEMYFTINRMSKRWQERIVGVLTKIFEKSLFDDAVVSSQ